MSCINYNSVCFGNQSSNLLLQEAIQTLLKSEDTEGNYTDKRL